MSFQILIPLSIGVGLAGLVGLLAWVGICRHWPQVVDAFGLPRPVP